MDILNLVEEPKGKATIATFTVYIPALQLSIHQMRLVKTKNGNLMVSFPSKANKQPDGSFQFTPYLEMGKDRWKDFQEQCLKVIKPSLSL